MEKVWLVRAGEGGYLIKDFAKGYVAVGYRGFGDMSDFADQESIRNKYIAAYPQAKKGEIGNQVAMFYKFRTVIRINDKVISFDPEKREYLVGTITSDYYYPKFQFSMSIIKYQ